MGLIIKRESSPTNIYYVPRKDIEEKNLKKSKETLSKDSLDKDKETLSPSKESLSDLKESLPNNIDNNINNINTTKSEEDGFKKSLETHEKINTIIKYLNKKCNITFKHNTKGARKCIIARLKEGYTLEDFYSVIDYMYEKWYVKPYKFSNGMMSSEFMRPMTLFGEKMENYLYEAKLGLEESSEGDIIKSVEKLKDRSDIIF